MEPEPVEMAMRHGAFRPLANPFGGHTRVKVAAVVMVAVSQVMVVAMAMVARDVVDDRANYGGGVLMFVRLISAAV